MITSVTRSLCVKFGFVRSIEACPHIGEVVPRCLFFPFLFSFIYILAYLLACPDPIIRCRNVVNGSKDSFPRILLPIEGLIEKKLTISTTCIFHQKNIDNVAYPQWERYDIHSI